MLTYVLFIIGFIFLIKGADLLVDGASSIAKKLNIPCIVIGLTIVAFGTSMPELVVNIFASINGNTDIAIGNVLGSNIVNIFLILGVSALIYPIKSQKNTTWKEIPFSLLAAIVIGFMANDYLIDKHSFSGLSRIDGLVLLSFFAIFMYYTINMAFNGDDSCENNSTVYSYLKSILFIILGLISLVLGGKWIVDGATLIAHLFGLSESVIGLTVVAIGTSLPELATSVVAARKKQSDIAIGNVVGSNIFNIFFVLGTSAVIKPLPFSITSNIDIIVTIFASLFLFVIMFIGHKHTIQRRQAIEMIVIYIAYISYLLIS